MAIVADLGFEGIDIGVFHEASHVTLSSVRNDPARRGSEIAAAAHRNNLTVADVFLTASPDLSRLSPTSHHSGDQLELQDLFGDVLTFAQRSGCSGVTLLPGVIDPGVDPDHAIELAAEGLKPLVDLGAAAGLMVSVEPHVGSCIESPQATQRLLDLCPGLSVTLDPSHYAFQGWEVPDLLGLIKRTRHVQVRPARPGVMQARVSEDGVDLPLFVNSLIKFGYQGWVASEYVWMDKWDCNRVDNTSESSLLKDRLTTLISEGAS